MIYASSRKPHKNEKFFCELLLMEIRGGEGGGGRKCPSMTTSLRCHHSIIIVVEESDHLEWFRRL